MKLNEERYQPLINNIRKDVVISDESLELVLNAFKEKTLVKKEILLYKGDVSNHMRFVAEGCLRAYYINEQAQEFIVQFGISGWWINDLYSFLSRQPANHFIQAIQKSTVFQIHRDALARLYDEVPEFERFFRIKFEKAYVASQERNLNGMSLSVKERYEEFRKTYRDIEQSVPQYMVASYLGVTPEFLSSLRKSV